MRRPARDCPPRQPNRSPARLRARSPRPGPLADERNRGAARARGRSPAAPPAGDAGRAARTARGRSPRGSRARRSRGARASGGGPPSAAALVDGRSPPRARPLAGSAAWASRKRPRSSTAAPGVSPARSAPRSLTGEREPVRPLQALLHMRDLTSDALGADTQASRPAVVASRDRGAWASRTRRSCARLPPSSACTRGASARSQAPAACSRSSIRVACLVAAVRARPRPAASAPAGAPRRVPVWRACRAPTAPRAPPRAATRAAAALAARASAGDPVRCARPRPATRYVCTTEAAPPVPASGGVQPAVHEAQHAAALAVGAPPQRRDEQPAGPPAERLQLQQRARQQQHHPEQEREHELRGHRPEQARRPRAERRSSAVAQRGRDHRGRRQQQVEQADELRPQQVQRDEAEQQQHPERPERDQQQASQTRDRPALRAKFGLGRGRAAAAGRVAAAAEHAQQRGAVVDRVARRLVRRQREEQFPVGPRRAQQCRALRARLRLLAFERLADLRGSDALAAAAAGGLRPGGDRQCGALQMPVEQRGLHAPAHVAELQIAPRSADDAGEQAAHAVRERPRRPRRGAFDHRSQRARARLVDPAPERADGAGGIGDHPQAAGHHREHQRRLTQRLGDAPAHEAVVGGARARRAPAPAPAMAG